MSSLFGNIFEFYRFCWIWDCPWTCISSENCVKIQFKNRKRQKTIKRFVKEGPRGRGTKKSSEKRWGRVTFTLCSNLITHWNIVGLSMATKMTFKTSTTISISFVGLEWPAISNYRPWPLNNRKKNLKRLSSLNPKLLPLFQYGGLKWHSIGYFAKLECRHQHAGIIHV